MGNGIGRLASLVGALMQGRIRVGSPPSDRRGWRQIGTTTVRRGVVPLLHRPRPHRAHPHAPAPFVVVVHHGIVLHLVQVAERRLRTQTATN